MGSLWKTIMGRGKKAKDDKRKLSREQPPTMGTCEPLRTMEETPNKEARRKPNAATPRRGHSATPVAKTAATPSSISPAVLQTQRQQPTQHGGTTTMGRPGGGKGKRPPPPLKITLPAGAFIGYDPFEHPEDLQPAQDSYGMPIAPMEADGLHIMNPNKKDKSTHTGAALEVVQHKTASESQGLSDEFYHGLLPREDITRMLRNEGDFLIRRTEIGAEGSPKQYCLSVRSFKAVEHFVLVEEGGKFRLTDDRVFDSVNQLVNHYWKSKTSFGPSNVVLEKPVCRQDWEFHQSQIECGSVVGQGEFGQVCRGKLTIKTGHIVDAAIKKLKHTMLTKKKIEEVMNEARLMRMLRHPNIVMCHGVSADDDPLMVVMEFVVGGSLDKYLRSHGNSVPIDERVQMCYDAAAGLSHMHSIGIIHRDIAARNCLYQTQMKLLKLSDFGLSRQTTCYQLNNEEKAPVKTLAPEVFYTRLYTPACDIWAYGVLICEIFHHGAEPYPNWSSAQIKEQLVVCRYQLKLPDWAPQFMKEMLLHVFDYDPIARLKAAECMRIITANRAKKVAPGPPSAAAPPPAPTPVQTAPPMPPPPQPKPLPPASEVATLPTKRPDKKKKHVTKG